MKKLLFAFICLLPFMPFDARASISATEAIGKIIENGNHSGISGSEVCHVLIDAKESTVLVQIQLPNDSQSFVITNNSNSYSVNENGNEIGALSPLDAPRYEYGGSKNLLIRKESDGSVGVFLSIIRFDHHGNDFSSYYQCHLNN